MFHHYILILKGYCGSCVAFATTALIETCFKKVTGVFGDYSEQHLVDCAYDNVWASGCRGATLDAYAKWAKSTDGLLSEKDYPYLGKNTDYTCPKDIGRLHFRYQSLTFG